MASDITLRLREFDRRVSYRRQPPWQQKNRDRSLAGKARVHARKAARRGSGA
jgi:hypothetical protein